VVLRGRQVDVPLSWDAKTNTSFAVPGAAAQEDDDGAAGRAAGGGAQPGGPKRALTLFRRLSVAPDGLSR
jgi:hypothetical protein